jgi:hypothetical protein
MGLELVAAVAIFVAAVTFERVVVPRAFTHLERRIDRDVEAKKYFVGASQNPEESQKSI